MIRIDSNCKFGLDSSESGLIQNKFSSFSFELKFRNNFQIICIEQGLKVFRNSSDLFGLNSNPKTFARVP